MASVNSAAGQWRCVAAHVPVSDAEVAAASAPLPQGRSSNGAGVVGSSLLLFSGENTPRVPIDDHVHVCDLDSGKWSSVQRRDGEHWPCGQTIMQIQTADSSSRRRSAQMHG